MKRERGKTRERRRRNQKAFDEMGEVDGSRMDDKVGLLYGLVTRSERVSFNAIYHGHVEFKPATACLTV